jgi:hypothetical protein
MTASAGPAPPPRSPGDLRPWLVGEGGLVRGLAAACQATVLRPADWQRQVVSGDRPAFLVLEGSAACAATWKEDLDRLLARCDSSSIPALLWLSTSPIGDFWRDRCARFGRVFSTDRAHRLELEALGVRMPSTLWPATAMPVEAPEPARASERPYPVVWLGGWNAEWPVAWRERLAAVLGAAAERGLRIVESGDLGELPGELRPLIATGGEDREGVLRQAAVAIATDPELGSATTCPAAAFDAAACGAAVLTPHDLSSDMHFAIAELKDGRPRHLIQPVHDADGTRAEIDRLLADGRFRGEVTAHTARILANNHTYSHRLATLASAVGYRLVPDAGLPAPA